MTDKKVTKSTDDVAEKKVLPILKLADLAPDTVEDFFGGHSALKTMTVEFAATAMIDGVEYAVELGTYNVSARRFKSGKVGFGFIGKIDDPTGNSRMQTSLNMVFAYSETKDWKKPPEK